MTIVPDDYIGHKCYRFKTFDGSWSTVDPDAPPEEGQIPFALLDADGVSLAEGWATPYGEDGAYDLGTADYRGEYHGVRLRDSGYEFVGERPVDRKGRKGVFRVRFKKLFSPTGNRPRVLPMAPPV